jgi:hypothetical protein
VDAGGRLLDDRNAAARQPVNESRAATCFTGAPAIQAPQVGLTRLAVLNAALWANAVRGRSGEVKIALVLHELRDGDVLERDRIVGVGGDHRVTAATGICRR